MAVVLDYSDNTELDILDHGHRVFAALALLGLFGYAYEVSFFNANTWRILLPVIVVWDAYLVLTSYIDTSAEISVENQWRLYTFLVLGSVFLIPQYIALYLYGFRSKEIWNKI